MAEFTLTGGSATDFRPVFEHVQQLIDAGSFTNLRGLLYFTDGMGIYPARRPSWDTAFILLQEPPMTLKIPPWAIKLVLEAPELEKPRELDENIWLEDILADLPEF